MAIEIVSRIEIPVITMNRTGNFYERISNFEIINLEIAGENLSILFLTEMRI